MTYRRFPRAAFGSLFTLLALLSFGLQRSNAQTTQPSTQPGTQAATQPAPTPLTFTLTYKPDITDSFTGRVYLMLNGAGGGAREPRFGPDWFNTQPFFALDVVDWKPATPLIFDDSAIAFPGKLSELPNPESEYSIQAVMRRNLDSPAVGRAAGTAYSAVMKRGLDGSSSGNISLLIEQVAPDRRFFDTDQIKVVELRSKLLSDFHGRDITMRAAVILPAIYENEPKRRFPALYWIGGFGSDHREAHDVQRRWERTGFSDHIIRVVLDPSCYGGHHAFADSENNGPRGKALVEELIPYLESTFRLVSAPTARFLCGASSGGWASLWLQVSYPEFFGGVWSIAPDPVDFRDFQRIDLYKPAANMYVDEAGKPRPLARHLNDVILWYEPFAKKEVVEGEGGQLRSFEWVFSPRVPADGVAPVNPFAKHGLPEALYDRQTGAVNPKIAEAWKRYDIRLILEQNWPDLAPKLNGGKKINIFMGDLDTFYLEGATKLLKQSQAELKSDAVIEIISGADHMTVFTMPLRQRIDRELLKIFNEAHHEHARPVTYD